MPKKILLILFSSLFLTSCLELMTHYPDSEIVFIGNGADGAHLVVADVQPDAESPIESHVIHKSEMVPVSVRFRPYTEEPKEDVSAKLEWVARDFQGNQVMRLSVFEENETSGHCSFVQASSTESICRDDLETLLISDEHEPIFLADGKMVFIDTSDDLILYEGEHAFETLMSGVKRFFVGKDGLVYFENKENQWFYMDQFISMGVMTQEPVSIAYLSEDKEFFAFVNKGEGKIDPGLYRFDEDSRALSKVWGAETFIGIGEYQTDEFSYVRKDRHYGLGTLSCGPFCYKNGVVEISPEGLSFLELREKPKSLSVGSSYMSVQYKDETLELCLTRERSEVVVASDEKEDFQDRCEKLDAPEGTKIIKAVMGPSDQVYLSVERLVEEKEEPHLEEPLSGGLVENVEPVENKSLYEVLLMELGDDHAWTRTKTWPVEGSIEDLRLLTP